MDMRRSDAWRPMREADLSAVSAISDLVHGRFTEPVAVCAERLALHPSGCHVLERGGAAAGYLVSHPWYRDSPPKLGAMLGAIPSPAETYYLHDIALLPAARGSGAGRAALELVVAHARALGFGEVTLMAVGGADRFWAAQGFAYAEHEADASYGAGCHLMRLALAAT
jgi:GNAT superfamily N-acetyltransferase